MLGRLAIIATLVLMIAMSLGAVWNAIAPTTQQVRLGRPAVGHTAPVPYPADARRGFIAGDLQKWVADKAIELLPARALMLRLSNEIEFSVFGTSGTQLLFVTGKDNFLIGTSNVAFYCHLSMAERAPQIREWVSRIKEIQDFYTSRGKRFAYLTSPTKFALHYDKFKHRIACDNPDRDAAIRYLAQELRAAKVNVVDGAALTAEWQRTTGRAAIASGAAHWNDEVVAQATQAIIATLNGENPVLPPLSWQTTLSPLAVRWENDLVELLNLWRTEWRHPSPVLSFRASVSCPAGAIDVTIVGTSFSTMIGETLPQTGCVHRVAQYFYLNDLVEFTPGPGGEHYMVSRRGIVTTEGERARALRQADIVILEESALLAGRHTRRYWRDFYRLLFERDP